MAVKQLQDVYSFRKTGLTCHKWKTDTTKLKGIGKTDNPNEVVGEADNPGEGVDEADDPDMALLGLHVCIYKKNILRPMLGVNQKDFYK